MFSRLSATILVMRYCLYHQTFLSKGASFLHAKNMLRVCGTGVLVYTSTLISGFVFKYCETVLLNRLFCSLKTTQTKVLALHPKRKLLICACVSVLYCICVHVWLLSTMWITVWISTKNAVWNVRNLILPATQGTHCCQTEAQPCHCEHIINQLFMEQSQERFNLPLLSN